MDYLVPRTVLTEKTHRMMHVSVHPLTGIFGCSNNFLFVNNNFIMFKMLTQKDMHVMGCLFPIKEKLLRHMLLSKTLEKRNIFVEECTSPENTYCGKIYVTIDVDNPNSTSHSSLRAMFLFFEKYSNKVKALSNVVGKPYFLGEHNEEAVKHIKPIGEEFLTEAGKRLRQFFIDFDNDRQELEAQISAQ